MQLRRKSTRPLLCTKYYRSVRKIRDHKILYGIITLRTALVPNFPNRNITLCGGGVEHSYILWLDFFVHCFLAGKCIVKYFSGFF